MKIRIDFGRVLPGILLLLSGLLILVGLLVVAIISFLFSFIPVSDQVLHVSIELMLLPALLILSGVVTVLTGVNWWGKGGDGWFSGIGAARAKMDRLHFSNRIGEVFSASIALVIFLFLYENQVRGVAFFTSGFDDTAKLLFYGPLIVGVLLSLARAAYGRRNAIRPFDSLNALFLAASAFLLLSSFPFDFTHLADMFPSTIQFIFSWLTNDMGRFLLFLAGFVSVINFAYTSSLYIVVRGRLSHAQEVSLSSHLHS